MCYSCATNPSIHHHCRCIVAMSLLLSHHGVAFAVALLWFHCRCHGVAFIVALSRFCHHCRGVTFVSVMVSLLPSWCHLCIGHGFLIAVVVLPSHWSQFHRCHHGVAFIVTSIRKKNFILFLLIPFLPPK